MKLSQSTMIATLLGCSALYLPLHAEAATASAKTSWAVSRVASANLGSYCTMAQKYSDDTVLTFAQNTKGEYSLALDFKDAKFKADKKQSVSINVGAKTKTFDVTPQSDKTAVLAIGKDADFIKKISAAEKVNIKIDGAPSEFQLSEFADGQKELGSCIEALQQPSEPAPQEVAAQKSVTTSSPKPVIHKNEIVLKDKTDSKNDSKEPSVEGLLAAMPKPSADITPVEDEIVPVIAAKQPEPVAEPVKVAKEDKAEKIEKLDTKPDASHAELASLRDENARLSRSLSEQRKAYEDKQASADGAALSEARQKLDAAINENQSLRDQLDRASALKDSKSNADTAKLSESVKALQQENQTLKNQIQIYANAKNGKESNAADLAKLQSENADLKLQVADLKAAPKNAPVASADASSDAEVNKLRADNRKMDSELALLKTEKETLQGQVSSLQKDVEGKQMKMSGGSWDLEQATRRYQESQREIVRLGSLLQTQDVKCANEKKDIEYMLFDPAIATKAQIAMLNSMEDQIKDKDAQLASAKTAVSPEKDAKIAELQQAVVQAKLDLSNKDKEISDAQAKIQQAQASQADLVALKADAAKQAQQLADAQAKAQAAQTAQAALATKDQTLAALQADVAAKNQQLAEAQTKTLQATQAQNVASLQKAAELDTLKTQLAQAQTQLATERANAQQNNVKAQSQQSAEQASAMAALQLQVQQANQTIIQLQNQISSANQASLRSTAAVAAVAPAAAAPAIVQANYAPVAAAPVASAHFKSIEEFSALLKNAGISVRGALQQVKGGDPSSYRAYSWKTDSLYGSAEMKKVSDVSQFDSTVSQYLSRAKSRCAGEFAAVPSPTKTSGASKSQAYEIACVGQSSSSSASVLFTYSDNIATTVAHEGRAEAMDLAIDARDRVSSKIN